MCGVFVKAGGKIAWGLKVLQGGIWPKGQDSAGGRRSSVGLPDGRGQPIALTERYGYEPITPVTGDDAVA